MPPQGELLSALNALDPGDKRTPEQIVAALRDAGLLDVRSERFVVKEIAKRVGETRDEAFVTRAQERAAAVLALDEAVARPAPAANETEQRVHVGGPKSGLPVRGGT